MLRYKGHTNHLIIVYVQEFKWTVTRNFLDLEVTGQNIEGGANSNLKLGASWLHKSHCPIWHKILKNLLIAPRWHASHKFCQKVYAVYNERISSTQPMKSNKLMLLQASKIIVTIVVCQYEVDFK